MNVHNFGAGPGILPYTAIEKASDALLNLNNTGLSILEISHRSKDFEEVINEAESLVKNLLNVPEGYSILFLQGGASTQFAMVPMNYLPEGQKAAYLETGVWAKKAVKEAQLFGEPVIVASSKDKNYTYIPTDYTVPSDASYLHITSNNTIYGTQLKNWPVTNVPVICDMSSDIFSRKIDVSKFDLIYAGAQKNMGPAGVTLVIVKNDSLGKSGRKIPSMFNYQTHVDNNSLYNTPPVFAIYVCMATLEWLKSEGGVDAINKLNKKKADLLYTEIDSNPLFKGTANADDRSPMNVCFLLNNPDLEAAFNEELKTQDIIGLKGHRSVGGYRASMYNALPLHSVEHLVKVMHDFAEKNG